MTVNVCLDKMCKCVCRKIYSWVWEEGGRSKYTSEGPEWRKMGEVGGVCKGDPISLGSVRPN